MENIKKTTNIAAFLDESGKIKQLPRPNRTKIPVLQYLCDKFEKGRFYHEKEVNQMIDSWHTFGDYFILRRSLIDYKLMARTPNGQRYWVVETENKEEGNPDGSQKGIETTV